VSGKEAPPVRQIPVIAPPVLPPPVQPKPAPAPAPVVAAMEQIPAEVVAVIAAAVAVILGRPHRVVSVEPALVQTPEVNVWALEGRMEHFMSHKVR
ncbi:MAG TPA: hypothetical protein VHB20_00205, partial [Verrucomicrobiae bacterium]|nr:hypothetical protein [Verrucomicrobiae bacterium]